MFKSFLATSMETRWKEARSTTRTLRGISLASCGMPRLQFPLTSSTTLERGFFCLQKENPTHNRIPHRPPPLNHPAATIEQTLDLVLAAIPLDLNMADSGRGRGKGEVKVI